MCIVCVSICVLLLLLLLLTLPSLGGGWLEKRWPISYRLSTLARRLRIRMQRKRIDDMAELLQRTVPFVRFSFTYQCAINAVRYTRMVRNVFHLRHSRNCTMYVAHEWCTTSMNAKLDFELTEPDGSNGRRGTARSAWRERRQPEELSE